MSAPKEVWVSFRGVKIFAVDENPPRSRGNDIAVRYVLASDVEALIEAAERTLPLATFDPLEPSEKALDAALAPFRKVKP